MPRSYGAWPAGRWARRWMQSPIGWLLGIGLVLRLVHYLGNHTIWYDEAALLANILDKDCARLLGPLDYEVAAPPLFLWGLKAIAVVFGDRAYVWRFPPFALGCLSLILMAVLASRVLRPAPALLLVALVAFSNGYVWLGCNVKPYILDAFLATGILYVFTATEGWSPRSRLLLFASMAPLLLGASYAMLFLYAGLFLAFLPACWRRREAGTWFAYLGLVAVVFVTFGCLYFGPIRAQRVPGLVSGWMNKFPDMGRPASVPGWVLGNTFLVFHYCYNPIGAGCVFLVGIGAWSCWRDGRGDRVCLCLGPIGACLLAAFNKSYPYSNNRLILFAAPGIGLMIGFGASVVLDWCRGHRRLAMACLATVLIVPEVGFCIARLETPWSQPDAAGAARYVKEHRVPGDLVATQGATFTYFFFGDVRSLAALSTVPPHGDRRVWVLVDDAFSSVSREKVLSAFSGPHWEVQSEVSFSQATVYLMVSRPWATARGGIK